MKLTNFTVLVLLSGNTGHPDQAIPLVITTITLTVHSFIPTWKFLLTFVDLGPHIGLRTDNKVNIGTSNGYMILEDDQPYLWALDCEQVCLALLGLPVFQCSHEY